jgi:hypothetical protein
MGRFDVRARHPSPVYELFPVLWYNITSTPLAVDIWVAVQRTKEPLHAAYLNARSQETRNCQSLLSSFSTLARHSAAQGYATNQGHAASLSRHRRACSCKDGTLVGELGISAPDRQMNSVTRVRLPEAAATAWCTTNSAQPPRSSDLETQISHVILMTVNLMATRSYLPSRLQLHYPEPRRASSFRRKEPNQITAPIG